MARDWRTIPVHEQVEIEADARRMRRGKTPASWVAIARKHNCGEKALRSRIDLEFGERTRGERSNWRAKNGLKEGHSHYVRSEADRMSSQEIAARLAEIPEDTRDLTGVLMGDPLPGRRAIDRMGA